MTRRGWIGGSPACASFIVITVYGNSERFPERVRAILTSRGDKADGKIGRYRRNKGECLRKGVGVVLVLLAKDIVDILSPLFLKLHVTTNNRIRYSGGVAPSRGAREMKSTCRVYMHYWEREKRGGGSLKRR